MSYEPTGAISDSGLTEIGLKIIGEEGFDPRDEQCLRRAYQQWGDLASPVQRRAAEQVWLFGWLAGLHREQRERRVPLAIERPAYVTGTVIEEEAPEQSAEPVVPVTEVKYSSESEGFRRPEAGAEQPEAGRPAPSATPFGQHLPKPPVRRDEPVQKFGPLHVSHAGDQQKPPADVPAPVQQPSRKIIAYQSMFPELGFRVTTRSGPKLLADCDAADIAFQIAEVASYRQGLRTQIAVIEARIENRENANARDRVANAERRQFVRENQQRQERLEKAAKALADSGMDVVGELPEDILDDCGFKRRVA